MNDISTEEFLQHFGVKGMKWGVRTTRSASKDIGIKNKEIKKIIKNNAAPNARKQAKQDVASVGKSAREAIKQSRNATTKAEKTAAAEKYKKEVLDKIKTKEFKDSYKTATTMGKGEKAAHVILFGPLALLTIPATKNARLGQSESGYALELAVAKDVLKEMRE